MSDSDDKLTKVTNGKTGIPILDGIVKLIKELGIPAALIAFGAYEWHVTGKEIIALLAENKQVMTETKDLLKELKHEVKKGP